jgi:hypothetical protein
MSIITIDPSLNCTAVVVDDVKYCFVKEDICHTSTGKYKKWFESVEHLINIVPINYKKINLFSEQEIAKLKDFDNITDLIIETTIPKNIKSANVFIEGYSYSSMAGPLIDLVSFTTLLRYKLLKYNFNITIVPPKTLKMKAAQFTYEPIKKGKKIEYRNNQGISGGQFKKPEIYKTLIENKNLNCEWVRFLRDNSEEILKGKNIPKPIEDINDAKLLYEMYK